MQESKVPMMPIWPLTLSTCIQFRWIWLKISESIGYTPTCGWLLGQPLWPFPVWGLQSITRYWGSNVVTHWKHFLNHGSIISLMLIMLTSISEKNCKPCLSLSLRRRGFLTWINLTVRINLGYYSYSYVTGVEINNIKTLFHAFTLGAAINLARVSGLSVFSAACWVRCVGLVHVLAKKVVYYPQP